MKMNRTIVFVTLIETLAQVPAAQELSLQKILDHFTAYSNIETATVAIETVTAVFSENGFNVATNPAKIDFSFTPEEHFVPKMACYHVVADGSKTINGNDFYILSRTKKNGTFFGGLLKISPEQKLSAVIYNPGEDIMIGERISCQPPYIIVWHKNIPPSVFNTRIGMFLSRHDVRPATPPNFPPAPEPPSELSEYIKKVMILYHHWR